ncbi:MAG TPA: hypothetical protein DCE56_05540 [Cyanobacteria bacterium UBA8553]|nr:hypothetical protein [Cyanobacteria bacterium UBA8553]
MQGQAVLETTTKTVQTFTFKQLPEWAIILLKDEPSEGKVCYRKQNHGEFNAHNLNFGGFVKWEDKRSCNELYVWDGSVYVVYKPEVK